MNVFKYHVSCTNGKISIEKNILLPGQGNSRGKKMVQPHFTRLQVYHSSIVMKFTICYMFSILVFLVQKRNIQNYIVSVTENKCSFLGSDAREKS